MREFWAAVVQYGIPAAFVLVGVWLVQRNVRKQTSVDASQRQIDNLQEDREALYKQFTKASEESARREADLERQQLRSAERIETLERQQRELRREFDARWSVAADYISELRVHIDERLAPPPPPFPPELRRHRDL